MIVAARALATPPPRQGSADLAGVAAFLVKGLGYKVVLQSLAGGVRANHLQGTILYVAAASGSLLLTIIAAHTARHRRRWPGTVHVLAGALYFVLSPMWMAAVFRPQYVRHFILEGNYWGADRYFVLPSCFFFLLVLLSLRVLVRPRWLTPLAGLSALLFAVAVAQNFRYARIPDFGWRRQLRAYYQSVLDRREPGRDDRFSIVTFPGDPWVMQAPLFSPTERERDEIRKLLSRI